MTITDATMEEAQLFLRQKGVKTRNAQRKHDEIPKVFYVQVLKHNPPF